MTESQLKNAPWNVTPTPEASFAVTVSQTLSKDTEIITDDFYLIHDDDTGEFYKDTSETDWQEAYINGSCTPLDLIEDCKTLCEYLLNQGVTTVGQSLSCP